MENKRIIIDVSAEEHRQLKARAAHLGVSMKDMFLEAIRSQKKSPCELSNHIPNEETLEAMKNASEGKNLTKISLEDFAKKLGL